MFCLSRMVDHQIERLPPSSKKILVAPVRVQNQDELQTRLDCAVLPKKGGLSQADREREIAPEFVKLRRQHSVVESAINALEVHGLDKCRDHGLKGFKR
jgi:transposase, IS5 family